MKRARFFSSVLEMIENISSQATQETLSIHFENRNIWCDMHFLQELVQSQMTPEAIFNISLFWWQYENQAAWRMSHDYAHHIESLRPHICEWKQFASGLNIEHQIPVVLYNDKFCNHKIMGSVDSISGESLSLFEWKFSPSGINSIHRLQAVLYSYALHQNTNTVFETRVVNLCTGELEKVQHDFVVSHDIFKAFFCENAELTEEPNEEFSEKQNQLPTFSIVSF